MRYHAFACDYDGTIATDGKVDRKTLDALTRLKRSGRKLILVTGRILPELLELLPEIEIFDRVVAEDGALLYCPESRREKVLAETPPREFVEELKKKGVHPVIEGRSIVATFRPHETAILETIRDQGLELQIIFNKNAVMVLPSGVNKAYGLRAALKDLRLSPHNVVGIGDAENDHAFLTMCECAVAVANALRVTKEAADLVTSDGHGAGAMEVIDMIIENDLVALEPRLRRHELLVGVKENGDDVRVKPYGDVLLLAGTSGGGKSTFASSFLERLREHEYQFCVIDPEGDYPELEGAVVLGSARHSPALEEIMEMLQRHDDCIVNLVAVRMEDRPEFFERLLGSLLDLRARTGRPHWIIVDETHHLVPASWGAAQVIAPKDIGGMMFITVHPDRIAKPFLEEVDVIFAIGATPGEVINTFSSTLGVKGPMVPARALVRGEAIAWWRRPDRMPFLFRTIPPTEVRRRHVRKYAEGELPPERSFYFRGPKGLLKLRAQNLNLFLQIGDGVDDETWLYHLREGDFSTWLRDMVKDDVLAGEVGKMEKEAALTAQIGRDKVRSMIEQRYGGVE